METTLSTPLESKKTEVKKELDVGVMTSVVASAFPVQSDKRRKIVHLWHRFFRVNFVCIDSGTVPETHFVGVSDDGVIREHLG